MCIVFVYCIYVYISVSEWSSGFNGAHGKYVCVCIYCIYAYMCTYLCLNIARDLMAAMVGVYVYVCIVFMYIYVNVSIFEWSSGFDGANGGYVCIYIYCIYIYMCTYLCLNRARVLMAPMAGM